MTFRSVKTSLENILKTEIETGGLYEGKFQVIGYQKEIQSAEEVVNNNRSVQVYYESGNFDGAIYGDTQHKATFKIDLTVGTSASVDLSGLDLATSDSERAAILANHKNALAQADEKLDELIEYVYQIIMAGKNSELGADSVNVASRQLVDIRKNEPIPRGEYAVISATMTLECMLSESLISVEGVESEGITTNIEIKNDDVSVTQIETGGI